MINFKPSQQDLQINYQGKLVIKQLDMHVKQFEIMNIDLLYNSMTFLIEFLYNNRFLKFYLYRRKLYDTKVYSLSSYEILKCL